MANVTLTMTTNAKATSFNPPIQWANKAPAPIPAKDAMEYFATRASPSTYGNANTALWRLALGLCHRVVQTPWIYNSTTSTTPGTDFSAARLCEEMAKAPGS